MMTRSPRSSASARSQPQPGTSSGVARNAAAYRVADSRKSAANRARTSTPGATRLRIVRTHSTVGPPCRGRLLRPPARQRDHARLIDSGRVRGRDGELVEEAAELGAALPQI